MKVVIKTKSEYVPVRIPVWNIELFRLDPDEYLRPIMEQYPADAYWEVLHD